ACFLAAVKLLRFRHRAYEGIYRVAETKEAKRDLAELIQAEEATLSGTLALLAARCLREAGDPEAARHYFKLADRLAPSDSVRLEFAGICLKTGSPAQCLEALRCMRQPAPGGRGFFFGAGACGGLG